MHYANDQLGHAQSNVALKLRNILNLFVKKRERHTHSHTERHIYAHE